MKTNKPRGPVPSLIGGTNGKPRQVTAKGKSTCKRCKVTIERGSVCIEIPQIGHGFSNSKRYCVDCFAEILEKSRSDLNDLSSLVTEI